MNDAPTIFITGATDGLGRALAEHLAAEGAHLVLHGRDQAKLDELKRDLTARHCLDEPPATVQADLAELSQVRVLAQDVQQAVDHLDVLVNNAGIGAARDDRREVSADGHELRFAVNYLAGFDLTLRLLPLLGEAGDGARIVNVASLGQYPIDFHDVMIEHDYSGTRAYGQSKLAQIAAGFTLARRLPAHRITVNSLHPATYMPTKIVRESVGYFVDTLETGEAATYQLIIDPALDNVTGRFYNRTRQAKAAPSAYDAAAQERLWQLSLNLTGAPDPR